jgi:hypothetical protein
MMTFARACFHTPWVFEDRGIPLTLDPRPAVDFEGRLDINVDPFDVAALVRPAVLVGVIDRAGYHPWLVRIGHSRTGRNPNAGACSGASPRAINTQTVRPGCQYDKSLLTQTLTPCSNSGRTAARKDGMNLPAAHTSPHFIAGLPQFNAG